MANQFNILDYTDGPLLKTGQIVDDTPAGRTTKDDGGFQRGIAGSKADEQYQILTTGQYSGTTTITINSIVNAHSNECVFDKVTGLMWDREETPSIYGTGAQGLLWDDSASNPNAEDIFAYCDAANVAGLSGFTDWRIPNIVEFVSLLILDTPNALPNSTAFPTVTISNKWTSTRQANNNNGYIVNLNAGSIGGSAKTTTRFDTILVRLGIE